MGWPRSEFRSMGMVIAKVTWANGEKPTGHHARILTYGVFYKSLENSQSIKRDSICAGIFRIGVRYS